MSIVTLATQQQNAMVAGFTHLLGNLVKKHRQSQGDYANSPVGDPSTTQLLWQAEAKGGLLLPAHAALQRGVPMLQDSCRVQGQEGGEDGIHGDVWDDASISGHWEKLLDGGSRGDTQTRTCQDHCSELCCVCVAQVCVRVCLCVRHTVCRVCVFCPLSLCLFALCYQHNVASGNEKKNLLKQKPYLYLCRQDSEPFATCKKIRWDQLHL